MKTITKYLIGQKYGRLTVIGFSEQKNYRLCRCDCGNEKEFYISNLRPDHTTSCGCFFKENIKRVFTKHGESHKTRLYRTWCGIKDRCNRKSHKFYSDYGGRGIKMYDEWSQDFTTFRDWSLSNGYSDDLQIDRTDNDLGYSPANCRWTTRKVNVNNTRRNVKITAWGETKTILEWMKDERVTVSRSIIWQRIYKLSWKPEEALALPKLKNQNDDLRTKLQTSTLVA